jgi:multicomponent Na+:H+ antiporter subunit G
MIVGSSLFLLAALGLMRLPDALCRSHAVAKASCLGVLLLLLATGLALREQGAAPLLFLTALFQFLTIPIASHLFGRLGLRKKISLWGNHSADRYSGLK